MLPNFKLIYCNSYISIASPMCNYWVIPEFNISDQPIKHGHKNDFLFLFENENQLFHRKDHFSNFRKRIPPNSCTSNTNTYKDLHISIHGAAEQCMIFVLVENDLTHGALVLLIDLLWYHERRLFTCICRKQLYFSNCCIFCLTIYVLSYLMK